MTTKFISRSLTFGSNIRERFNRNEIPVRCINTGEEYPSLSIAADSLHCTPGQISKAINHGTRARGMRFEKI